MRRLWLASFVVFGCADSSSDMQGEVEPPVEETSVFCLEGRPKIDVLFVVDDSASMADQAASIAENSGRFGSLLDDAAGRFDIAVHVTHGEAETCTDAVGTLVDSTCRERRASFVSNGGDGAEPADVWEVGCNERCGPAAMDDSFESTLACVVPAGIDGCEQESPLAAMVAAVERSSDPSDVATGSMRDDASLFAVVLTDEDESDEAQVLGSAAVLRELRDVKQIVDPEITVAVAIAAGWDSDDAPLGCTTPAQQASAPTRLDVFRRAADDLVVATASICDDDLTPLFAPFADSLADQVKPLCVPHCVALDEASQECSATLRIAGDDGVEVEQAIVRCDGDASPWTVPAGADRCVAFAHDEAVDTVCADEGSNVEAVIVVADGAPPFDASCIAVTCEVSATPEIDCPDLG